MMPLSDMLAAFSHEDIPEEDPLLRRYCEYFTKELYPYHDELVAKLAERRNRKNHKIQQFSLYS